MNYKKEDLPNLVGREFVADDRSCVVILHGVSKRRGHVIVEDIETGSVTTWLDLDDFELLPEIPEGFTRWFGGECPVDGDVKVDAILVNGEVTTNFLFDGDYADEFNWLHDGSQFDIIGYRIIEEEKPKELDISEYWQVVYSVRERGFPVWIGGSIYESRDEAEVDSVGSRCVGYKQVGSNIVELV